MTKSTYTLRDYQERILKELAHLPSIALFMGTGTGKTLTSINRFKENPTDKLLVICPSRVAPQWRNDFAKFEPSYTVLPFRKSWTAARRDNEIAKQKFDVVVVGFEIIWKLEKLKKMIDNNWTIIVDESHKIKEWGTRKKPQKTTRAVVELGSKTDYKVILTATPTQKQYGGYIDYWSQLKFLGYCDDSLKDFREKYCIEKKIYVPNVPFPVPSIIGYKNVDELENLLKMISRRYVPTNEDIPPQHFKITVPRARSYARTLREQTYKEILLNTSGSKRVGIKTLTSGRITGTDFYDERYTYDDNTYKRDWVEEFLSNTDEVVAIMYQYNVELEVLEEVCKKLKKKYVVINGANDEKYDTINKKDYDVMLGQYQAAAESLDGLQHKCHIMILYAMPESSLLYKQGIGRIDRIGQSKPPMYYYLVMENTLDEDIYEMTQKKVEYSEETLEKLNLKL